MKQFFKFVFATIVGIVILTVLLFVIVIGIAVGISGDKTVDVASNSVMRIALTGEIKERTPNNPLAAFGFFRVRRTQSHRT